MSSVLSELTCLALHRPGLTAAVAEVSAYYAELAQVHEHLAEAAHTSAERDHELALAAAAQHHADVLTASAPGGNL